MTGRDDSCPVFLYLFDCITEYLAGPFRAILISVGVHPKRDRLVTMPEFLRYAGDVSAVRYCHASEAAEEFVRVETRHTVPLRKLLKIARRALWVHWFRASVLSEDIRTDYFFGLLTPQRPKEGHYRMVNINHARLVILWGVKVNAFLWSIAEVSGDGDGVGQKINVLSLKIVALSAPDACIHQRPGQHLPLQRLLLQALQDMPQLFNAARLNGGLRLVFTWLWPLNLVHRILGYSVGHIGHLKKAMKDGIAFDNRGGCFPL